MLRGKRMSAFGAADTVAPVVPPQDGKLPRPSWRAGPSMLLGQPLTQVG